MNGVDINLSSNQDVLAARKQLIETQLRASRLDERRVNIDTHRAAQRNELDDAANALLDGEEYDLSKLEAESADTTAKLKITQRAVEIQQKNVLKAELVASREICEKLKPQYESIISELADALLKVMDASERETKFRDELIENGVMFAGQIVPNPFRPAIHDSHIARWFRDAINENYLKFSDVPQQWHHVWGIEQLMEIERIKKAQAKKKNSVIPRLIKKLDESAWTPDAR